MKILYITNGITGSGGLERVLSIKTSWLSEKLGNEVHIMAINEDIGKDTFFNFSKKIVRHNILLYGNTIKYYFNYQLKIRELVKNVNPDVIIVCDDGLKGFYVPKILKTNIPIVYERHASVNISVKENVISQLQKKLKHFLMKNRVNDFANFVVLTKGNLKEWGSAKNLKVIPNPVSFYPQETSTLENKKIIAVGSQGYNKGTDMLLNIWEKVEKKFPDWHLEIYGKPHPDNIFENQAKIFNIENLSFFPPVNNILEKYLDSSIFVLTSRSEGFGMVLIEAMSCGIPCVSFDCPHGPKDVIKNNEDGILVENGNTDKFAEELIKLMQDTELRKKMGEKARENSEKYLQENIMKTWSELFNEIIIKKDDAK